MRYNVCRLLPDQSLRIPIDIFANKFHAQSLNSPSKMNSLRWSPNKLFECYFKKLVRPKINNLQLPAPHPPKSMPRCYYLTPFSTPIPTTWPEIKIPRRSSPPNFLFDRLETGRERDRRRYRGRVLMHSGRSRLRMVDSWPRRISLISLEIVECLWTSNRVETATHGNGDRPGRWSGSLSRLCTPRMGRTSREGKSRRVHERTESPLGMYEAINLTRQIASSLVRSQANCWDAVEYRVQRLLFLCETSLKTLLFPRLPRPGIDERTID